VLTLPAGVSVQSISPSAGSFAGTTWTLGNLANGATQTLTAVLTVNASTAPGTNVISGATSITAVNQTDSDPSNNSDTESTSVAGISDLVVTQSESIDPVIAGSGSGNLTYVATVTNNGPTNATGVELGVVLTLPAGVSVQSITPSAGSFAGTTWTLGNLASGATQTLMAVLTVDASAVPGTDVISGATSLTAVNQTDSDPSNNSDTESTSVIGVSDLVVTQSESIDPVIAGSGSGNLTYVATVTNNGPSNATGVELGVVLTLPAGVSVQSITPSAGSFAGTTWTLGNLASGATQTLMAVLTVDASTAPGTDVIRCVTSTTAVNQTDSDPSNNSATESTSVSRVSSLGITKTDGLITSFPGNPLTYTIVISKGGPSDLPSATVTDSLPAGLTGASWTCVASAGASCTAAGSGDINDPVSIPAGANLTYTINATVDPNFIGTLTNTAGIASSSGTSNTTDTTTIISPAMLSGFMEITGEFQLGGRIFYNITLTNSSVHAQFDNPGNEFVDILPPELTLISANLLAGGGILNSSPGTNTVSWSGPILGGGSVEMQIEAVINSGANGEIIANQGNIFFDADGDGSNEALAVTDDPSVTGTDDQTVFLLGTILDVPTLGSVGLAVMTLLLTAVGLMLLIRRRA